MNSGQLIPKDQDTSTPASLEVEFALVFARMLDSVGVQMRKGLEQAIMTIIEDMIIRGAQGMKTGLDGGLKIPDFRLPRSHIALLPTRAAVAVG